MSTEIPDIVDLGCGNNPKDNAFGVDIRDYEKVDLQSDIQDLPDKWTNSVTQVYCSQVLEHLEGEEIANVLEEVTRILESGGTFTFDVPYARIYTCGDPTHQTEWKFQTIMYYLSRDEIQKYGYDVETFPDYFKDHNIDLKLIDMRTKVWLDLQHKLFTPLSFGVKQLSKYVDTDKWNGIPVIGGLVAGNIIFELKK